MDGAAHEYAERAYDHIRYLSEAIGPRPSTGAGERAAAAYAAQVLRHAGLREVREETFESPRSTYAPYRRIFAAALLGALAYRRRKDWAGATLAALLSGLAAHGFYAEADLAGNWTRLLRPCGRSQNVVGVVPAAAGTRQRIVLYGHLDSHRTPIFYSNVVWLRLFSLLLGAAFVSLGLNTALYGAEALGIMRPARLARRQRRAARLHGGTQRLHGVTRPQFVFLRRAATGLQLLGLALTVQADLTDYTASANDNASGAATALALGERLARQPLQHSEVWVVNTGCKEVGAYGIAALLDRHGDTLGDTLFIDFDMVGIGDPAAISRQGLLRRRDADGRLLAAARAVAAAHPALRAWEHTIDAYDDSYMVAKRGFRGITIDAEGRPGTASSAEHKHWHRLTDTVDKLDRDALRRVHEFAWHLLQHLDGETAHDG